MSLFSDTYDPDKGLDKCDVIFNLLEDIKCLQENIAALEKRDEILTALEAGGVDNWTWYDESLQDAGVTE